MGFSTRYPWRWLKVETLNKNGLPYCILVFLPLVWLLYRFNFLIEAIFLNPGFPFIRRGQDETPQSGQPAERSQKSQAEMYPRPQIHRRIQEQRLMFHFNSLATQSQPCERRQAALRFPSETIKRWKTSAPISSMTQRPLKSAW